MKEKNTFIICLFVLYSLSSCDKQDDLYSVQNPIGTKISSIIAFQSLSPTQIEADSFSLCTIKVKINPEADAPNRTVKFKVSGNASFTNGDTVQTVVANTEGYAIASFKNAKVETVHLTAIVSSYSIDTTVKFTLALPDDMQLEADSYVLDRTTSQPAVIKAKLFRNANRGIVSNGAKIFYTFTPLDTTVNFIYQPFQYSFSQMAIDTAINPFKTGGRFNIEAKTLSADGTTLSKMVMIRVR